MSLPNVPVTMRRGLAVSIDGVPVTYLGRGEHATAYKGTAPGRRVPEAYLLIDDELNDGARDVYAQLYARGVPHIPAVEVLGWVPHGKAYRMPFYRVPPTGEARERMMRLVEAANRVRQDIGQTAARLADEDPSLAFALRELAGALPEPSRWALDLTGSNMGMDAQGELILLDVAYSSSIIHRQTFGGHTRHNPAWRDPLPGGLADGRRPSDFPRAALARGVKVELEHTRDRRVATKIAMDHLTEDPHYYERLARCMPED